MIDTTFNPKILRESLLVFFFIRWSTFSFLLWALNSHLDFQTIKHMLLSCSTLFLCCYYYHARFALCELKREA